jgi:hypothetical protein
MSASKRTPARDRAMSGLDEAERMMGDELAAL